MTHAPDDPSDVPEPAVRLERRWRKNHAQFQIPCEYTVENILFSRITHDVLEGISKLMLMYCNAIRFIHCPTVSKLGKCGETITQP
jgi:hypothetical protein